MVSRYTLRATHDRKEIHGRSTYRQGGELQSYRHPPHIRGKIAEEWGAGTSISELMGQRLEQEERERERINQELQVARRIQHASLPKEVPTLAGWQISPYYQPAREVEETSTTSTSSLRADWGSW